MSKPLRASVDFSISRKTKFKNGATPFLSAFDRGYGCPEVSKPLTASVDFSISRKAKIKSRTVLCVFSFMAVATDAPKLANC